MGYLLTVEERFEIQGRGLILLPGISTDRFEKPVTIQFLLITPDKRRIQTDGRIALEFLTISPPQESQSQYVCILNNVKKVDVPIGTEVWIENLP